MGAPQTVPYLEVAAIVAAWPTRRGYNRAIADHFGVPITTARSWVFHARRRGYLPSGADDRPCRHCNGTGTVQWGWGKATRRTGE